MSYIFYWPVSKSLSEAESLLEWAKQNCPSYIKNDGGYHDGGWYYRFYFGDQKDYLLFLLRWA